jgi:hypothetical protein
LLALRRLFQETDYVQIAKTRARLDLLQPYHGEIIDPHTIRLNRCLFEDSFGQVLVPSSPDRVEMQDIIATAAERKEGLYGKTLRRYLRNFRKRTAELHLKLALSFACIGFASVGIPVGLLTRSQSKTMGFTIGLLVAFAYYIAMKFLQGFVENDRIAWWSMWLPNLVMLAAGTVLWLRCQRLD